MRHDARKQNSQINLLRSTKVKSSNLYSDHGCKQFEQQSTFNSYENNKCSLKVIEYLDLQITKPTVQISIYYLYSRLMWAAASVRLATLPAGMYG